MGDGEHPSKRPWLIDEERDLIELSGERFFVFFFGGVFQNHFFKSSYRRTDGLG